MYDRISRRLTYANVTATLAMFIALGGASYAAANLPPNSVGTAQLEKAAVTNTKLAKGAVTGAKVANGSLTGQKIKSSTLGTVRNATHATNATNADELGGLPASTYRGSCPSGMTLAGARPNDLCVDSSARATQNWSDAAFTCASAGLRLPSVSEALLASDTGAQNFWTSDIWNDNNGSTTAQFAWYFAVSGITDNDRASSLSVRCVATPSDA